LESAWENIDAFMGICGAAGDVFVKKDRGAKDRKKKLMKKLEQKALGWGKCGMKNQGVRFKISGFGTSGFRV